MELTMKVAIAALAISFFNLIGILINSAFVAKTYKKNKRLEFLQRRDHLSQKISELNEKNTEAHLISARYELVAVKNACLPLKGEQAERNKVLVASIRRAAEGVEKSVKQWEESIVEKLHLIYRGLTLESDAPEVERMMALVQVASDNLKKVNDGFSASLLVLETTSEWMKTDLAETDEKIRQINIDAEKAMARLRKDLQ